MSDFAPCVAISEGQVPRTISGDLPNVAFRHGKHGRYFGASEAPALGQNADGIHHVVTEFGEIASHAVLPIETHESCVPVILSVSCPFKVRKVVVGLAAIDVVDVLRPIWARSEAVHYKMVDRMGPPLADIHV